MPNEHQRDPLVERDAGCEFQSLHPIGGDRGGRLGGEQAGQDDVPARREPVPYGMRSRRIRAKVKTSFSKPGSLVQVGVPVLCETTSRAVRQVSYSGRQCSPPPHPPQRWAVLTPAASRRMASEHLGRRLGIAEVISNQ